MNIPYAVKFKRVKSENKVEIERFLNECVPSSCIIECDASTTNKSLNLENKSIEAKPFDKNSNRLEQMNICISNFKSKVAGSMHGIALQFVENELADFEWKYLRRKWSTNKIFFLLGKSLMHYKPKTRQWLIDHFKQVNLDFAI